MSISIQTSDVKIQQLQAEIEELKRTSSFEQRRLRRELIRCSAKCVHLQQQLARRIAECKSQQQQLAVRIQDYFNLQQKYFHVSSMCSEFILQMNGRAASDNILRNNSPISLKRRREDTPSDGKRAGLTPKLPAEPTSPQLPVLLDPGPLDRQVSHSSASSL